MLTSSTFKTLSINKLVPQKTITVSVINIPEYLVTPRGMFEVFVWYATSNFMKQPKES